MASSSECNKCKANGFVGQQIKFLKDGVWPDSGKPKWKLLNLDDSTHNHKQNGSASSPPTPNPSSLSQETVDDSPNFEREEREARQEFFKRKEEKYDQNILEYKAWQTEMLDIALQTLEAIKNMNIAIQAFLHPNKPTIHKASELEQHKAWENVDNTIENLGLSEDRPVEDFSDERGDNS